MSKMVLTTKLKVEQYILEFIEDAKKAYLQAAEFTPEKSLVFLPKAVVFNGRIHSFVLLHAWKMFQELHNVWLHMENHLLGLVN